MTTQEANGRARWAAAFAEAQAKGKVRDADYTTISGLEVDPVYGPDVEDADARMERIGWPGEFPFTRSLYPSGYRGRPWTIRQFAGFGNGIPMTAAAWERSVIAAWRSTPRPTWICCSPELILVPSPRR